MSADLLLKNHELPLRALALVPDALKNTFARAAIILNEHSVLTPDKPSLMALCLIEGGPVTDTLGPAVRQMQQEAAQPKSRLRAEVTAARLIAAFECAVRDCSATTRQDLLNRTTEEKDFIPLLGPEMKSLYVRARESFTGSFG